MPVTTKNKADDAISLRIEESLESEVGNRNVFVDAILKNKELNKGVAKMHYSVVKYKKKLSYDILKDISEIVTLFQLMYYSVNLNHSISVVGYWIF